MEICAIVDDLLDRSRIAASVESVHFTRDARDCAGAAVVVVDLARHVDLLAEVRAAAPGARVVGFAPHVDDATMRRARDAGADVVLARSRFFRDVGAVVGASSR